VARPLRAAGAWIKPRLGGEFGAVTLQVPEGFAAYARVFHPASDSELAHARRRSHDGQWGAVATSAHLTEFHCGTTAHREMQWHSIVGLPEPENYGDSKWSGQEPSTGTMDLDDLDALCEILAAHTADPEHVFFGLCTIELWEESFTKKELKRNRLLRLPWGRHYIVLAGPLSAVDQLANDGAANPGPSRATFTLVARGPSKVEESPENRSGSVEPCESRDAPNLIWPADHSWLVASEVDFDSTLVGGSAELIQAIVDSPKLEAWRVEPTDSLAADADKVNAASREPS
jgi:hypothetical protein